ncbi:MAG: hypothetical protein QOI41_2516 [Myxococcales bacterium]|jgi:ABC-type multidrug transport system permease subunit|nr:hypothetical protein [Myxococcales bacterium]
MITDRMTAKVLGYITLLMAVLVVSTCFVFARPETRSNPRFATVVVVSSIPMFLVGALLLRKAARMKDEDEPSK